MPNKSPLRDKQKFTEVARSTSSIKQFLESMGLRAAGGNFKSAHKWSKIHEVPLPVAKSEDYMRNAKAAQLISDSLVFCENSSYANRFQMKKRLKEQGLAQSCSECGLGDEWNKKPLVLQLDHINGIHNDNRKENLRLLCPNCHSQTDTFCSRNLK